MGYILYLTVSEVNEKMTIIISNLRKPGMTYDSSKLSILGNKISGDIQQRTHNQYISIAKVTRGTLTITIKQLNPETGKYSPPIKNEQTLLAGRISNFLNSAGISHDIRVR